MLRSSDVMLVDVALKLGLTGLVEPVPTATSDVVWSQLCCGLHRAHRSPLTARLRGVSIPPSRQRRRTFTHSATPELAQVSRFREAIGR